MPAKKKTEAAPAAKPLTKKAPAKKAAAKKVETPAPAPVAPAAPTAPTPAAPAKKAPVKKAAATSAPAVDQKPKAVLSPEERYQRVQMEAYFIAEKDGFRGDPQAYWAAAEAKIAAELA